MKNVTSIKSGTTSESPKTPGGISKTLLTPCRRIGLSRKWKNKGPSPFVSPVSSSSTKTDIETPSKKRKCEREEECSIIQTGAVNILERNVENKDVKANVDIVHTPSRPANLPRKRTKILQCTIEGNNIIDKIENKNENEIRKAIDHKLCEIGKSKSLKLTRMKSNKKIKNTSPVKINDDNLRNNECTKDKSIDTVTDLGKIAENSPNNLTKECIVVIQKNIFNNDGSTQEIKNYVTEQTTDNKKSHVLIDSDSDDIPLNKLNTLENIQLSKEEVNKVILGEDDNFVSKKSHDNKDVYKKSPQYSKQKVVKSKIKSNEKSKVPKLNVELVDDDDDDFEMDSKRTILIKKTYEKVTRPQKAKSTGSITQKDVEELRARIEEKKNMLLAKTLTNDTQELRDLIKKWQRGCQDALMELMDLMKEKCDNKMEYKDILQMLKIPSSLVGYDSDNEYFVTPDDASIVLAKFNE